MDDAFIVIVVHYDLSIDDFSNFHNLLENVELSGSSCTVSTDKTPSCKHAAHVGVLLASAYIERRVAI